MGEQGNSSSQGAAATGADAPRPEGPHSAGKSSALLPPGCGLTKSEHFLLEWLSREDVSALGECEGADLSALVSLGLATVNHQERGGWAGVMLTDAGHAALSALALATGREA